MLDTPNAANSGPFCISNKGKMMQDDERYETDMYEGANMLKLPVSQGKTKQLPTEKEWATNSQSVHRIRATAG